MRHNGICQSRNFLLSLFTIIESENTQIGSTVHPQMDLHFLLPFFLVYNKYAPYSKAGTLCHGSKCLASWETLFVIPTTDRDHITFPLFIQNISIYFCGHVLLTEGVKLAFITQFNEFLTTMAGKETFSFILIQPTA